MCTGSASQKARLRPFSSRLGGRAVSRPVASPVELVAVALAVDATGLGGRGGVADEAALVCAEGHAPDLGEDRRGRAQILTFRTLVPPARWLLLGEGLETGLDSRLPRQHALAHEALATQGLRDYSPGSRQRRCCLPERARPTPLCIGLDSCQGGGWGRMTGRGGRGGGSSSRLPSRCCSGRGEGCPPFPLIFIPPPNKTKEGGARAWLTR